MNPMLLTLTLEGRVQSPCQAEVLHVRKYTCVCAKLWQDLLYFSDVKIFTEQF